MGVAAVDKPPGVWCRHFKAGAGCAIYTDRPGECRTFECEWLRNERWAKDWRPDRSKMIMVTENDGKRLNVVVDPSSPAAWRADPYYSRIKAMSQKTADGHQLIICVDQRRFVIFPDQDVDLGVVNPDSKIVSGYAERDGQIVPYAMVLRDA